ncbi:MAG: hypothetical protein K2P48_01180 [Lachnospiraceae bacterium]|nr:hypothetical protein [Lachnospiraceae bacterium]
MIAVLKRSSGTIYAAAYAGQQACAVTKEACLESRRAESTLTGRQEEKAQWIY